MVDVLGLLFIIWFWGAFTAILCSDWPIEEIVFWPIEIIRRYWTKRR